MDGGCVQAWTHGWMKYEQRNINNEKLGWSSVASITSASGTNFYNQTVEWKSPSCPLWGLIKYLIADT
jgi:hypothetical protein